MSTADGVQRAVGDISDGGDCRSDKEADDDERQRVRLGRFTIGDEMSDASSSTSHRYVNISESINDRLKGIFQRRATSCVALRCTAYFLRDIGVSD